MMMKGTAARASEELEGEEILFVPGRGAGGGAATAARADAKPPPTADDELSSLLSGLALGGAPPSRVLVVLDLNGFLVDRVRAAEVRSTGGGSSSSSRRRTPATRATPEPSAADSQAASPTAARSGTEASSNATTPPPVRRHDATVNGSLVWKRPHCDAFVAYLIANFDVGVWSCANEANVDGVLRLVLTAEQRERLKFVLNQEHCAAVGTHPDNPHKPLFVKDLAAEVWSRFPEYASGRTLLVDDSPYKAARNPPHTAIHPPEWTRFDPDDDVLAAGGVLRGFLDRLLQRAAAASGGEPGPVPAFVRANPVFWS